MYLLLVSHIFRIVSSYICYSSDSGLSWHSISHQPSAISHQPSAISHQRIVQHRRLNFVNGLAKVPEDMKCIEDDLLFCPATLSSVVWMNAGHLSIGAFTSPCSLVILRQGCLLVMKTLFLLAIFPHAAPACCMAWYLPQKGASKNSFSCVLQKMITMKINE